ncbi:type II toxin-antitoxin system RelB/DinJ family antitoxin [Pseudomonas poae]|nr:type II toxin-antitoxin system RelB/DinJ family antitoxin [Pseudomonas poae]
MACTDVVFARPDGGFQRGSTSLFAKRGSLVSEVIQILLVRIAADKILPLDKTVHALQNSKAP